MKQLAKFIFDLGSITWVIPLFLKWTSEIESFDILHLKIAIELYFGSHLELSGAQIWKDALIDALLMCHHELHGIVCQSSAFTARLRI